MRSHSLRSGTMGGGQVRVGHPMGVIRNCDEVGADGVHPKEAVKGSYETLAL